MQPTASNLVGGYLNICHGEATVLLSPVPVEIFRHVVSWSLGAAWWRFLCDGASRHSQGFKMSADRMMITVVGYWPQAWAFPCSFLIPLLQTLTQIVTWIDNMIHCFPRDVITHPCPNINGGLAKSLMKSGLEWVITFHWNLWMSVLTYALIKWMRNPGWCHYVAISHWTPFPPYSRLSLLLNF